MKRRRVIGANTGKPERKKRRGMRPDQLELAASARQQGMRWYEIAALFRDRYRMNGLVAMRLAHSFSQNDLAKEWHQRWPDDLKTFKNFSYWENWPSSTAYAPSLPVLVRLAEVFECSLGDLLEGYCDFRHRDALYGVRPAVDRGPATLALAVALEGAVERLAEVEVDEVTAAGLTWADRLPPETPARELLMKLSAGLALAVTQLDPPPADLASVPDQVDPGCPVNGLAGLWWLDSGDRPPGLVRDYAVVLRRHRNRMIGSSLPRLYGGRLRLDLHIDRHALTGTWTIHDHGGTAHGAVRLSPDTEGQKLCGQWIGLDVHGLPFDSKEWELHRMQDTLGGRALLGLRAAG